MKLETARLTVAATSLAFACIFFASAGSSFGQGPAQATPTPGGLGAEIIREHNADTTEQKPTITTTGPFDSEKRDGKRHGKDGEEMVVIDAATRQKEKENAEKQRDKAFQGSIMDKGVDAIHHAKPSARPALNLPVNPMLTPGSSDKSNESSRFSPNASASPGA